jgi:hypothetical protein
MAMNMWQGAYGMGQQQQQNQQPMPPNSMITFINDDSIAVNYPVAPGTTVALINANDPTDGKMFIKSTEPNGMPNPMRVFALKEITPQKTTGDTVSRQEFEILSNQIQGLQQMIASLQNPANPAPQVQSKGGKSK